MSCVITATLVKQSTEDRPFIMDFSGALSPGETISSIESITHTLRGGGTSDLTVYNESSTSDAVMMWIDGGTANKTYHIEVLITTSLGKTLEGDGFLSVRDK